MSTHLIRKINHALPWLLGLGALFLYEATLAPGLTWGDSGEFITTAYTLGIGHPYGHPLYWLAGRVMMIFFPGDPVMAMNHLSALSGALTCLFVALIAINLLKRSGMSNIVLPVSLTTMIFATGSVFWSQALFTEVYTFQALLFTVAIYAFDRYCFSDAGVSYLYLSAYFFGVTLTLGMYVGITLVVPLAHVLSNPVHRNKIVGKLPIAFFWLLIGLTPWLYLYFRNQVDLPFTIKSLSSFSDFFDYLSRKAYDDTFVAGFGALAISLKQTARILSESLGIVGIVAISLLLIKRFRTRDDHPASTRALAALLTTLAFALMVPLTLSFRQMIDMDVYFIPCLVLLVPPLALGISSIIGKFGSRYAAPVLIALTIIPALLKYDAISMSDSRLATQFQEYLNTSLPAGSKVWPVSDEVAQVLFFDVFCDGNPASIVLSAQNLQKEDGALGGLGTAALSDFIEIDDKFIERPTLFDRSAIAGPFMSLRGATPEAKRLEHEFVTRFSPDSLTVTAIHRYDRIFLAQTWGRRGFYWLKKSNLPNISPRYSLQCVDSSIVCYRQAFLLDNFTFEGASHAGNLGIALVKKGDLNEADRLASDAISLNPRSEPPWRARLSIALKAEKYDEALNALQNLLEYSRYPAEIWLDLATLYCFKLNDPAKASTAYNNGINLGGNRRANIEKALAKLPSSSTDVR